MIQAQDGVIGRAGLVVEQGVGRPGVADVDPFGAQGSCRRDQDLDFLEPDRTALAGVRVERRKGKSRRGDAEIALHRLMHNAGGAADPLGRDQFRDPGERRMDGHQTGTQVPGGQHHHWPARSGERDVGRQFGDEFRMAGEAEACGVKRGLGDRGGDDPRGFTRQGQIDSLFDPVGHGPGVDRFGTAGNDRRGQGMVEYGNGPAEHIRGVSGGKDRFDRLALQPQQGGVADDDEGRPLHTQCRPGLCDDLRPHARRITHGQGQRRRAGAHHFISIRASSRRSRI